MTMIMFSRMKEERLPSVVVNVHVGVNVKTDWQDVSHKFLVTNMAGMAENIR